MMATLAASKHCRLLVRALLRLMLLFLLIRLMIFVLLWWLVKLLLLQAIATSPIVATFHHQVVVTGMRLGRLERRNGRLCANS